MINISPRLKQISSFVEDNSKIIDIGCDHGLVDIHLMQTKKNLQILASDINKNALNNAINNIKKYNYTDKIKTQVSDGIKDIDTTAYDRIIISGMGGRSIIGILKDSPKVLKKVDTIILSPNNYQEDVKRYLTKNNFYIYNEEFVKDGKFIYQIIIFKKGKKKYTKKDYFFGPVFLIKKGPLFREYYERELKSREILLTLLPKNYRLKRYITKKEISMIKKEIED